MKQEGEKNMSKISIIVPAYNVEEYITECIESITRQTYKDIEIIVVNDGSQDATGRLLDEMKEKDDRIVVIHKENGGVTSARNAGLRCAKSEYIGFVDGDDYIAPDMYENLYKLAEENDAEIVFSQKFYRVHSANGTRKATLQGGKLAEGVYSREDKSIEYVWNNIWNPEKKSGLLPDLWCNIYKRDKLEKVQFKISNEVTYAEDEMLVYSLVTTVDKVCITDDPYYCYRMRDNSAVNSVQENFMSDLNRRYLFIKEYYSKHYMSEALLRQLKYKTVNDLFSLRFLQSGATNFHMFPYELVPKGSDIILYGAGGVGKSYYNQINKNKFCNIVAWVDVRYENFSNSKYQIKSPEEIKTLKFDYILIAVIDKTMAESIGEEICNKYNVERKKIIVYVPNGLIDFIEI